MVTRSVSIGVYHATTMSIVLCCFALKAFIKAIMSAADQGVCIMNDGSLFHVRAALDDPEATIEEICERIRQLRQIEQFAEYIFRSPMRDYRAWETTETDYAGRIHHEGDPENRGSVFDINKPSGKNCAHKNQE